MIDAIGQLIAGLLLAIFLTPVGLIIPIALFGYAGVKVTHALAKPSPPNASQRRSTSLLRKPLPSWAPLIIGIAIIAMTAFALYLWLSQRDSPPLNLSNFQG